MTYQTTVLADNPLWYNRGGTADLGSLGNVGTIHGTVTTAQAGLLPNGDTQTSDLFDGSTGYISASDTGLPTGASAWSQELWMKPQKVTGSPTLFSFGTSGGNGISIIFLFSGPTDIGAGNWATGGEQAGTLAVIGTVYYVCSTYDGTNLRLYVGDTSANTLTTFGPKAVANNIILPGTLYVGRDPVGDFFQGYIQERAIYGTTLTLARVTAHWNVGITQAANLVSFPRKWREK